MPGDRCPGCGHTWGAHGVEVRGLTRRTFCWVVGCKCEKEAPQAQKTVEGSDGRRE